MHSCEIQTKCVSFVIECASHIAENVSRAGKARRSSATNGTQEAGRGGAPRRAMPCTLPLLGDVGDAARPAATRVTRARGIDVVGPRASRAPTLIMSIQLGWVGAARGADFFDAADLAAELFFAADIACLLYALESVALECRCVWEMLEGGGRGRRCARGRGAGDGGGTG